MTSKAAELGRRVRTQAVTSAATTDGNGVLASRHTVRPAPVGRTVGAHRSRDALERCARCVEVWRRVSFALEMILGRATR